MDGLGRPHRECLKDARTGFGESCTDLSEKDKHLCTANEVRWSWDEVEREERHPDLIEAWTLTTKKPRSLSE